MLEEKERGKEEETTQRAASRRRTGRAMAHRNSSLVKGAIIQTFTSNGP